MNATVTCNLLFKETTGMTAVEHLHARPVEHTPVMIRVLREAMEEAIRSMDLAMCRTVLDYGCPLDMEVLSCRGLQPPFY